MTIVAIDFETANRSAASPCALGLAFVENGVVTRRAYTLLRPRDMAFDPMNIRVHGIRPQDVLSAPEFPEVWETIRHEFDGALVLAHNASFDMSVLRQTISLYGLAQPGFRSFCTVALARRLWPEEPSKRLSALAARFGIGFRHHHAGEDAYACAAIALEGVRYHGAADVAELADRTGLARAVAAIRARPAGGIAARALAARGQAQAPTELRFAVSGSKGTPYDVWLRPDRGGVWRFACTCPGARFRPDCRHTRALELGDFGALIDPPEGLAETLARIVSSTAGGAVRRRATG